MDPAKIIAILEWEALKLIKVVQSFLNFTNFYWQFINGFSKIILPMLEIIRKNQAEFI